MGDLFFLVLLLFCGSDVERVAFYAIEADCKKVDLENRAECPGSHGALCKVFAEES
jgi:hypothetical protein